MRTTGGRARVRSGSSSRSAAIARAASGSATSRATARRRPTTSRRPSAGAAAARTRRPSAWSAVIGPFFSSCAIYMMPVLNRAGLAEIGPWNTYVGLTRSGPGIPEGQPEQFRPTGRRTFVRLAAPDDLQGRAHAGLARERGERTAYVLHDGVDAYGLGAADGFRDAAREGIEVVGFETWDPEASGYRELAPDRPQRRRRHLPRRLPRVQRGQADAGSARDLGDDVTLMATEGMFPVAALRSRAGAAAEGLLVTLSSVATERLEGAGADFLAQLPQGDQAGPVLLHRPRRPGDARAARRDRRLRRLAGVRHARAARPARTRRHHRRLLVRRERRRHAAAGQRLPHHRRQAEALRRRRESLICRAFTAVYRGGRRCLPAERSVSAMPTTSHILTRTIATALAVAARCRPGRGRPAGPAHAGHARRRPAGGAHAGLPHARHPGRRGGPPGPPVVEFVEVPRADGFDVGDAVVGAGSGLGLVLIATGGALTTARMRRRRLHSAQA